MNPSPAAIPSGGRRINPNGIVILKQGFCKFPLILIDSALVNVISALMAEF